ncbi:unnamed protein product [Ceratitis capitata]|uniref:(Mediterranean fruit fly) hypothetical protein n=1 Tax=Ceratitis capitata TaxID=7213 RepID=A0A811UVL4_CERCA|nr:unnamed protein product [Ceratitis capitata]
MQDPVSKRAEAAIFLLHICSNKLLFHRTTSFDIQKADETQIFINQCFVLSHMQGAAPINCVMRESTTTNKKLRQFRNNQLFWKENTAAEGRSFNYAIHNLSAQQQELIQQLQLVQRRYLIQQGFVKPLQLDFQAQYNNGGKAFGSSLNRGHQQLHLPQNSLGTGNDKYNETSYLLQHQQQMHIQHDQKLNIPVNEHRQHQGRQQKYRKTFTPYQLAIK